MFDTSTQSVLDNADQTLLMAVQAIGKNGRIRNFCFQRIPSAALLCRDIKELRQVEAGLVSIGMSILLSNVYPIAQCGIWPRPSRKVRMITAYLYFR
jgi:hypothetical protein